MLQFRVLGALDELDSNAETIAHLSGCCWRRWRLHRADRLRELHRLHGLCVPRRLGDNRWCQYWHGHESSGQLLRMGRHGERDRRCLLCCCWVLKYHRHGTME